MKFAVSAFLLLICSPPSLQRNSWQGLTPLRSTCEDVKKILKVDTCSLPISEYTLPDYRIKIVFADKDCDSSPRAWRVPKGTVLSLVISPQHAMTVSQVGIDISGFKQRDHGEIVGIEFYSSDEEGVSVELFKSYVMNVFLRPRKTDDALRCKPLSEAEAETATGPTCCAREDSDPIEQAWRKFTANGRYRIATQSDMRWRERKARTSAYTMSSLGYDRHETSYYQLAAIVIDTQRGDLNRFGLVIFSAPRAGNGSYKPYWVLRDRDLSNSYLDEYVGFLDLVNENEDGSKSRCSIQWNAKNKRYVCPSIVDAGKL